MLGAEYSQQQRAGVHRVGLVVRHVRRPPCQVRGGVAHALDQLSGDERIHAPYRAIDDSVGDQACIADGGAFDLEQQVLTLMFGHRSTTGQERIDSDAIAKVGVGVEGDRWSTTLYADNVLNEISAIYLGPAVLGENYINRPRTIGVTARFDF